MGFQGDRHFGWQGMVIHISVLDGLSFNFVQAGGKDDSAQGVGINPDRLGDALDAANMYLSGIISS